MKNFIILIVTAANFLMIAQDNKKDLFLDIKSISATEVNVSNKIEEVSLLKFKDLYESEYKSDKVYKRYSNTFGFYSQKDKRVYLCKELFKNMPGALTKDDIPIMRNFIIFHELVHAWQDKNKLIDSNIASHVNSALLEGHAEYMTEKLAQMKGWDEQFDMYMGLKKDVRSLLRKKKVTPDIFFYYAQGREFFKYLNEHNIEISIQELFTSHKPTEKEIMFPELYQKDRIENIDEFKKLNNTMGELSSENIKLNRISIISFKRYISAFTFLLSQSVKDNYLRAFSDGLRISDKTGETKYSLTAISFENKIFSKFFYNLVCRDFEVKKIKMIKQDLGENIDTSFIIYHNTKENNYMSITILRKDSFCFELKLYKKSKEELIKSTNNIVSKIIEGI